MITNFQGIVRGGRNKAKRWKAGALLPAARAGPSAVPAAGRTPTRSTVPPAAASTAGGRGEAAGEGEKERKGKRKNTP